MTANLFGDRFYGNRVPAWHNLGYVSKEDNTALEALTILGGGYYFEKRPIVLVLNGQQVEVGDYGIVRSPTPDDPTEHVFGYVTKQYNIIQPLTACELFDNNVRQPVETLGFLGRGEKMFLTWKMPEMNVLSDIVNLYGFIALGYDGKFGASLNLVKTRVVCNNTWNIAIEEAGNSNSNYLESGKGKVWTGKHNSINIERDLGIWLAHVQSKAEQQAQKEQEIYVKMAQTSMEDKDVIYNLLFGIYPIPNDIPENFPDKLRAEKQSKIDEITAKSERDVDLVMQLFDGQGTAINATAWGLFNSVTEYENWGRMTKKDANYSIMLGNRSNTMNKAYNVIKDYVYAGDNNNAS